MSVKGKTRIDKGEEDGDRYQNNEYIAKYDFLNAELSIHKFTKSDPALHIFKMGRHHGTVGLEDFAELHVLMNLNLSIIISIHLQENISDIVNVADFILINVEKEFH